VLSDHARSGTTGNALVLVLVLLVLPFTGVQGPLMFTLVIAMAWAIAAVGLDLLVGYSGQLSFGQAGFLGLGAYAITIVRGPDLGLTTVLALLVSLVLVGVIAYALGWSVTRLSAFGFAVSTFFFAFIVQTLVNGRTLSDHTGGPSGLAVPPVSLGSISLTEGKGLYVLACLLLALVVLLTGNLANSRTGHALRMIKANESVAAVCGVNVRRLKVLAFLYCCLTAVLGGLVYSLAIGYLSPDSFGSTQSVYLFAMLVVGGMGSIAGPILGALLLTVVPQQYLGGGSDVTLAFTAVTLLFLILFPQGLYGLFASLTGHATVGGLLARLRGPAQPVVPPASSALRRHHDDGPQTLLAVQDLTVAFGSFVALSEVSMQVGRGEFHAVIGPNGAGKTTLLNALSGLVPPVSGRVELAGKDVTGAAPRHLRDAGVSRTFQTPSLVPDLSVLDNVTLGMQPQHRMKLLRDLAGPLTRRRSEADLTLRAHQALDAVGLDPARRGVDARELTLSEQKHVEIARAVASDARLVLLDEPTAGLSHAEIEAVADTLVRLKDLGTTLVLIAHHIEFVSKIADSVTVMDHGRVIGSGSPATVLEDQQVRDAFLGLAVVGH
jgi:branched-chain amino acid transport system permease protein